MNSKLEIDSDLRFPIDMYLGHMCPSPENFIAMDAETWDFGILTQGNLLLQK